MEIRIDSSFTKTLDVHKMDKLDLGDGSEVLDRLIGSNWHVINGEQVIGGGRVVIPPGEFVTGTIVLRSNVHLYLAQGAKPRGSLDTADYRIDGQKHGMVYAYQATGITIS